MTVRELINDLQTNFANHLDCEVRIAEQGRGDKEADYPVYFSLSDKGQVIQEFVSIIVKGSPAWSRFNRNINN